MIYVRIHGRLGNQLFEYAAARGLAARHNTDVVVDERTLARMGDAPARPHFHWRVRPAGSLPPDRYDAPVSYYLWRAFGTRPKFLREDAMSEETLPKAPDNVYLHGYWQRPHYFAHIAEALREELTFVTPPTVENARLAEKITAGRSVSVHVRRGDFVKLGNTIPTEYYHRALARVEELTGTDHHVYFFSDDPAWVRDNLADRYDCTVVDHNGPGADFEDLRLISLCQHNVISLSSFSWSGAWLNRNPGKVVIGKGNPDVQRADHKGWYPPGWHMVKAD